MEFSCHNDLLTNLSYVIIGTDLFTGFEMWMTSRLVPYLCLIYLHLVHLVHARC
jgi:hypothetical protein